MNLYEKGVRSISIWSLEEGEALAGWLAGLFTAKEEPREIKWIVCQLLQVA